VFAGGDVMLRMRRESSATQEKVFKLAAVELETYGQHPYYHLERSRVRVLISC